MTEEEMQEDWGEETVAQRLYDPAGAARRAVPLQHVEEEVLGKEEREEGKDAGDCGGWAAALLHRSHGKR